MRLGTIVNYVTRNQNAGDCQKVVKLVVTKAFKIQRNQKISSSSDITHDYPQKSKKA